MNRPPDVSLVFETFNDQPHRRIRFAGVVKAWKRVMYSAAIGLAYEWAVRGKPRPFAVGPR